MHLDMTRKRAMDFNESIFTFSSKGRATQGTFTVGLSSEDRKITGAMKFTSVCNNRTLEDGVCPLCTEDMLRLTCEHRVNDSESSETCKSNSCLNANREDAKDFPYATHCKPSESMVVIISGIKNLFCIRFQINNKNQMRNSDKGVLACSEDDCVIAHFAISHAKNHSGTVQIFRKRA